jgi:hypothetical protein
MGAPNPNLRQAERTVDAESPFPVNLLPSRERNFPTMAVADPSRVGVNLFEPISNVEAEVQGNPVVPCKLSQDSLAHLSPIIKQSRVVTTPRTCKTPKTQRSWRTDQGVDAEQAWAK